MRGATVIDGITFDSKHISIHAPHARSDNEFDSKEMPGEKFQSTPLMRGATVKSGQNLPLST